MATDSKAAEAVCQFPQPSSRCRALYGHCRVISMAASTAGLGEAADVIGVTGKVMYGDLG